MTSCGQRRAASRRLHFRGLFGQRLILAQRRNAGQRRSIGRIVALGEMDHREAPISYCEPRMIPGDPRQGLAAAARVRPPTIAPRQGRWITAEPGCIAR